MDLDPDPGPAPHQSDENLPLEPRKFMNFDFYADPDPAFCSKTDPDPASKNNADPCECGSEALPNL